MPLGLKWKVVGKRKPVHGTEIISEALATALQEKAEFSLPEKRKLLFDVGELSYDSYIKVGDTYFQPAAVEDGDGAEDGAEPGDPSPAPCCAGKCCIS